MYWLLILLLVLAAGGFAWRLAYIVEWRTDNPGRHAAGHVCQMSRDNLEPETEELPILPVAEDTEPDFDPSLYRLSRAVRRWLDFQEPNSTL